MAANNISILIPFRGTGHRKHLWDYCRQLWQQLPYELIEAPDDGNDPFQIAQAFNTAAQQATGDTLILYGADHLPDTDRIEWAHQQLQHHHWAALYSGTGGISANDTELILRGDLDPYNVRPETIVPFCTAIIAIRRTSWIRYDERFKGWGGEDSAWRIALETIYGPTPQPCGLLRCLHHDAASREHTTHNYNLIGEYMTAQAEGRMVDYLQTQGLLPNNPPPP